MSALYFHFPHYSPVSPDCVSRSDGGADCVSRSKSHTLAIYFPHYSPVSPDCVSRSDGGADCVSRSKSHTLAIYFPHNSPVSPDYVSRSDGGADCVSRSRSHTLSIYLPHYSLVSFDCSNRFDSLFSSFGSSLGFSSVIPNVTYSVRAYIGADALERRKTSAGPAREPTPNVDCDMEVVRGGLKESRLAVASLFSEPVPPQHCRGSECLTGHH